MGPANQPQQTFMPHCSGREILKQTAGTSSLVTPSIYLQKTVGPSKVRNLSPEKPIQPTRKTPRRLGPPDRAGRKTSFAAFTPIGDPSSAPVRSKAIPEHIVTFKVVTSTTAPHHCPDSLPSAPPCPTSTSPAAASIIEAC